MRNREHGPDRAAEIAELYARSVRPAPPAPVTFLTWTDVAAGGTGAVPAGANVAFAFDTTGALDNAVFPDDPTDGQVAILKAVGASNTNGIRITPGAGQSIEDPGTPGTILAPDTDTTTFGQGVSLTYKYQSLGARWLIASNA